LVIFLCVGSNALKRNFGSETMNKKERTMIQSFINSIRMDIMTPEKAMNNIEKYMELHRK